MEDNNTSEVKTSYIDENEKKNINNNVIETTYSVDGEEHVENEKKDADNKNEKEGKYFAIASLALGIISIILIPFKLITGSLAIVFGVLAKKRNYTKYTTAGIICGVIGLILGLILKLILGFLLAVILEVFSSIAEWFSGFVN